MKIPRETGSAYVGDKVKFSKGDEIHVRDMDGTETSAIVTLSRKGVVFWRSEEMIEVPW